jgi:hypothetical protein
MKTLLSALVALFCLVSVCHAADAPAPPTSASNKVEFTWYKNLNEFGLNVEGKDSSGDFSFLAYFGSKSTNSSSMILDFKRRTPSRARPTTAQRDGDLKKSLEELSRSMADLQAALEPTQNFFWSQKTNSFGSRTAEWQSYASKLRAECEFTRAPDGRDILTEKAPVSLARTEQYYFIVSGKHGERKVSRSLWKGTLPDAKPFVLATDGDWFFRRTEIPPHK